MKLLRFPLLFLIPLILASCNNQTAPPNAPQPDITLTQQVPEQAQRLLDGRLESAADSWAVVELEAGGAGGFAGIDSLYDVFVITFLWGSFSPEGIQPPLIADWSGTLTSSVAAAINVRATIDFEHGQDSLIATDDSTRLAWVSVAEQDFDGFNLILFVRNDMAITVLPELFFESNAIDLKWTFAELEHLTKFYPIGGFSGLVINSRRLHPDRCPRGFMKGRWLKAGSFDGNGSFEGKWLNRAGIEVGYLNGIWWTTDDGQQLLEGSVSGLETDEVIAELTGRWSYDDMRMCPVCGVGHGRFHGRVRMLSSGVVGEFKGEFGDFSLPPNDLSMPFYGRWKFDCPGLRDGENHGAE